MKKKLKEEEPKSKAQAKKTFERIGKFAKVAAAEAKKIGKLKYPDTRNFDDKNPKAKAKGNKRPLPTLQGKQKSKNQDEIRVYI